MNANDKPEAVGVAKQFIECGFRILATGTTYELIKANGIPVERINKMQEGRPNIVDAITNKEIQLIINTPAGKDKVFDDSYIRKNAIKHKVPYITTIAAEKASAAGIKAVKENGKLAVDSIQHIHSRITR